MNNILQTIVCVLISFTIYGQEISETSDIKSSSTEKESPYWYYKELKEDSIPGISLDRAYQELISTKKGKEVVVAIIDTSIDIDHEDLKGQIWVNTDEIANNGIDDDGNGYIDDIHGWNFLGNTKEKNVFYQNFESTRIVRTYQNQFQGKTIEQLADKDTLAFLQYIRAEKKYKNQLKNAQLDLEYAQKVIRKYQKAQEILAPYFSDNEYTLEKLQKIDTSQATLKPHIAAIQEMIQYNITNQQMENEIKKRQVYFDYYLNQQYNDRKDIGDNPADIADTHYGDNRVSDPLKNSIMEP